ncbi:dienelactone hydrolase family protein [Aestuariicella hydrocarbonica]|uniref:Dienelactone hydrolase family protein n=1 Tax=Pseudomaricurvus hydrocarbonicus TaxID=1470433 RepID=A0A9E5K187_9GAMM|nr:dienelactone hydrolase family protein [Aestuariicella hydrocarbonica]NHO66977.1 dienelactone hydrolase family protein [Aestuariicella hydrocarbonica]
MCDEQTIKDSEQYHQAVTTTRRTFGKAGLGLAVAMMLPVASQAQEVNEGQVMVETPDGMADCYFVHPSQGRHAAVIMWPDIFGIREAYRQMGKRLAQSGYSVLVVNPYYRTQPGQVVPQGTTYIDPDLRSKVFPAARALAGTLSPQTCVTDGRAFVRFLDQQACVEPKRKIGTAGYCMTGSYTFRLAADMPDRIGAGASFHGGQLVTEAETSPHRLVPAIKAGFLVAIAENDDAHQPEAKTVLRQVFDSAGVDAEIEVYEGAQHGWCPPDSAVYNEAQAERAWSRLLALFEQRLV